MNRDSVTLEHNSEKEGWVKHTGKVHGIRHDHADRIQTYCGLFLPAIPEAGTAPAKTRNTRWHRAGDIPTCGVCVRVGALFE